MRPTTTAALFQSSLQTTDRWLKEIMNELGGADRHKAYMALRAALHALRERLPVDECAQLSAQLPLVIRGVYWEGWNPARVRPAHDTFLVEIHAAFRHNPEVDPEQVARAVFKTMAREISNGEMEDIRSIVPEDMRRLMLVAPVRGLGSYPLQRVSTGPVGAAGAAHWGA
jgi:uncharacterized protein (DUF2267 family)